MTAEPTTPLPESPHCRVRARVASIWADGPDAGTSPDWRPAAGEKVTLTPSIGTQLLVYDVAGPEPIIVTVERVGCEVDEDGWLVADGRPVFIAPTDDPLLSATGWTWTATIKGKSIAFSAPAGGVVDLALYVATPAVDATEYVSVVQIVADYIAANPPDVEQAVADYLTANPPPDATTAAKGLVRLAGDLAGTADAPTVPGLAGKADTGHTHTLADVTDYSPPDLSGFATTASLADVATSGAYADLTGTPAIPDSPDDIGAAPATHEHTAADIDSSAALDGHILTADGAGGAAWEAPPAGGGAPALRVPWAGYIDSGHSVAQSAGNMRTDATYLTPLFIKWDCNMTGLAIQVVAASTEAPTVGLVVYDSGADGLPLNRLALETVDVSTEGRKVASLAAPVPVSAGMCLWAGVVLSGGVAGLIIPYVTNNPSVGTPPSAVLDTPYNGTGWRDWRTAYGRGARTTTTPAVMASGDFTLPEGFSARYVAQVAVGVAP